MSEVNASATLAERVRETDWARIHSELDEQGWAIRAALLASYECAALRDMYAQEERFRSRIVMSKHGYGRGEYKYLAYPLPALVAALRTQLYPALAKIANQWQVALSDDVRFPASHADFLARCHAAGQQRPTPLLLSYQTGDYNCLHQDIYGEHVFPLQVAILLSQPERDFEGGELVMTEQRPRMQSRAMVLPVREGDAVVFAVRQRPVRGARGSYRVNMRHGVSKLRTGQRMTLGVIFHDAT
jgi:hypothetical protein